VKIFKQGIRQDYFSSVILDQVDIFFLFEMAAVGDLQWYFIK
jgi:hypothetical protein